MTTIQTHHTDVIHDAVMNWYGNRLASCSSDKTIKIFDVSTTSTPASNADNAANTGSAGQNASQQQQSQQSQPSYSYNLVDTLHGHEGPVWQVSWAHPKFGKILASCSYDGRVIVWREGSAAPSSAPAASGSGNWQKIKEHTLHNASVNSLSWAPHELGAILACVSSDGKVSVLSFSNDGAWDASLFVAHPAGVNAISWAPAVRPSSLFAAQSSRPGAPSSQAELVKKFATGGCDSIVRVWAWRGETKEWFEEDKLEGHTDWVRDVAWAPNIGLPRSYLASAGQDKTVIIHIQDNSQPGQGWSRVVLDPQNTGSSSGSTFPDTVYRLSWSISGAVLAVSCGNGKITLWKERMDGQFELVSDLDK